MNKNEFIKKKPAPISPDAQSTADVSGVSDDDFRENINIVLRESEEFRLKQMGVYRSREFMSLTATLLSITIGGAVFAWFFLVVGSFWLALLAIIVAGLPHIFMRPWVLDPVKTYRAQYKQQFMPRIARAMGGLRFNPKKGIPSKILARTGIVPAHDMYSAEDCFSGNYKNARITLSEARLSKKGSKSQYVFDGIFVLIELSRDVFEGHSVITADQKQAQRLAKKLQRYPFKSSENYTTLFTLLSSSQNSAQILDNQKLLTELHETMVLFEQAPLSIAFFGSKYIFLQIPYEKDMFEASDVFVPITTNESALRCKKEIDQLMSIIDIIGVYDHPGEKQNASDDGELPPEEALLEDYEKAASPPQPEE